MASSRLGDSSRTGSTGIPILSGAVAGLVSFVLVYGVTYLLKSGEAVLDFGGNAGDFGTPEVWQQVAWYFFQMHNVGTSVDSPAGGGTVNYTGDIEVWFLLLPVVVLLIAGFAVAWVSGQRNPADGAVAGATVAVPYLVLAVALALLSGWSVSAFGATLSVQPSLPLAALLAGIGYPVVCGGIGGALAGLGNG